MKKLLIALVCFLIVFAPVVAAAQPDAQTLEEYIQDEYGLEAGEYELGEPWILEFDGLTYYVYYIYGATREDYFKGDIVWVEEEERFVGWEEFSLVMEDYYEYQRQYWEELQQQAGKMDVWLYSQLLEMNSSEEVEIYILPRFELTPELEREIRDLFRKYDLDPPEGLRWWAPGIIVSPEPVGSREPATAVPPGTSGGQDDGDSSDGVEDPDDPVSDDPDDEEGKPDSENGYEGEGDGQSGDQGTDSDGQDVDSAPGDGDEESDPYTGDEDGYDGDGDWDVWIDPVDEEFYTELAHLYAKGFEASRKRLETALKAAGAEYSFDGMGFIVTTTAKFALDLRDNEDVEWISGLFYAYATDDSMESMPPVIAGLRSAALDLESPSQSGTPWFLIGGLGLVMAGLAWLVIKKF